MRGAADRAIALGGHDQAVAYLEDALEVAGAPADRAELLERAATSADSMTDYAAAERFATRAVEEFRTAGDSLGAARATALLGWSVINAGDVKRASQLLAAAHAELPESERGTEIEVILLVHLSRAAFRGGEMAKAAEFADRALALAEPRNDEALIAEAFINKGSSYDFDGRVREATALYEAALRIARAKGLIASELRAINNLGGATWGADPTAAVEIVRSGVDLAARVGNRGMGAWLVGTYGYFSFILGVDWPGRRCDPRGGARAQSRSRRSTAARQRPRPVRWSDGRRRLWTAGGARGARGGDHRSAAAQRGSDRPRRGRARGRRPRCGARGRPAHRRDLSGLRRLGLRAVVRVAIARGDAELATTGQVGLDALAYGDRATSSWRAWAAAVVSALEGGGMEAKAAFRTVLAELRALGFDLEIGRTTIDMVRLFGLDDPFVREAAEESKVLFERIGARAWSERLDEAVALARGDHPRDRRPGLPPTRRSARSVGPDELQ